MPKQQKISGGGIDLIEARVCELDENLELSTKNIFDIVCQEYHLVADLIEKELNCKCPFALIGFLRELEQTELSDYSVIELPQTRFSTRRSANA
ncbi:hypothetical protein GTQ43_40120 [Nostoc sp. KVJ3]|uniref:hypothetical protein n=1 Tax=Nostoc sp. KVJ3 TaxID=457945 RepID=UPI002238BDAC|nr:hypothetical protein [Nostoc sp. KVJ3]MCW5319534.1 hypothetical protein [Nostoc sp. KVJ3]